MILVTGGTGFIGQALIRGLIAAGERVRILLRAGSDTPGLLRGTALDVAISSYDDERSLRAVFKGVDTVYHLASAERKGVHGDLERVDIGLTRIISAVAAQSGTRRLFYISHLGAERSSAFTLLRAKGIAEHLVINCGVRYTIFRSAPVFGPGDRFGNALARLARRLPAFFLLPGDGESLIQPIWIEDLVTCLVWANQDEKMSNQVIPVGGPEALTFKNVVEMVLDSARLRRNFINFSPAYLRMLTLYVENTDRNFPVSTFWLDYLSANRICPLDTLPKSFGLLPARFSQHLDYLRG